ncbi:MAG: FMN-binding protein [Bacteroidaceae bacterium]|nr:FMN-binding protein [Bacteroidaceae bacterium]
MMKSISKCCLLLAMAMASECAFAQGNTQSGTPRRQRPVAYVIPTDAPILTKEKGGTYVINTSGLCKDVKGYKDLVPVEITIKSDKIVNIEVLRNNEGPKYMASASQGILDKYIGMKVKKVQNAKVDAVAGATFTSNALIQNINAGLNYYLEHK